MLDTSPSIWQQDNHGDWKLYFNTESNKVSPLSSSNKDQLKTQKDNNDLSQNNIILGTLVMTPKGIGRLIKKNNNIGTIRFNKDGKEDNFPMEIISNNFNCFIFNYLNGVKITIRLKLKVSGKVSDIFTELEKIKKINLNENNFLLLFNKEIIKKENTFEQINIFNNSKILLIAKKIVYTISRYINTKQYWYMFTLDGICFSPSQTIKLIGVGLYGSNENKIISAILKILDGPSVGSKSIFEENIEISPSTNTINAINKFYFPNPIVCKKNQDYSIILNSKTTANIFYGTNGKNYIDGEKGVGFFFKKIQGKNGGTGVETGNFPEFYYYLH